MPGGSGSGSGLTPLPPTGGSGSGSGCPEFCPEIYQPVCGTDGRTYGNTCKLQAASCQSSTPVSVAYEGACVACPAERPEFGSSCSHPAGGRCSYGEECCCGACHPSMLMECGGGSWVGRPSEACMLPTCPTTAPCPEVCTADYTPVCGSDGQTYSNLCHLNIASCNSNTTITVSGQGECQPAACGDPECNLVCPAGERCVPTGAVCVTSPCCPAHTCTGPLEGQTIAWVRGMSPAELCVTPGTNVTFSWTSGHNLVEVADLASYTSCSGLSPTSPASGPVTWAAPRDPGAHYFACGVPGHCNNGMKAKVEVAEVCAL